MGEQSPELASTPTGVFLSYASQDAEAARRICDALRAAGIEVWFDQSELRGGDAWDRQIRKQIHDCALFIPVISVHSDARQEGYFRREWRLAVERAGDMAEDTPFLLPVVIDSTSEATARVPDRFRDVQWSRLTAGQAPTAFIERVQRLLAPEPSDAPTGGERLTRLASIAAPKAPVPRHAWWSKPSLLVLVLLFIAGGVYLALDRFGLFKRPAPAATAVGDKSIAVLPFIDMSEKHDQEYFADGLAEEVIDLLARIPGLHVVGRTSSFQFRGRAADVRAIGTTLNAAYVLEGSVRRSGNRLRLTAQLISTSDGTHRWSDTYDTNFEDIFEVQDSIASNLARTLEVAVSGLGPSDRVSSQPEAYDLYMQGRQALDSDSEEGINKAVALFTEVVRLDPKSSRALAWLAKTYTDLGAQGWMPPAEAFEKGRETAQQALQIDKANPLAHSVLANIAAVYDWDWQRADREIAVALNGDRNSQILTNAAQIVSAQARWTQALEYVHEALAKDPLSADAHMIMGAWIYLRAGKYKEAEKAIRRALQIRPHWGSGRFYLSTCLLMEGRLQEALQEAEAEQPKDGRFQAVSAVLYAMRRQRESDGALSKAIDQNRADWPSSIAKLYAFRGQREQSFEWLRRAYEFRDAGLYFIKGDPLMRKLEGDERYKAFLRKMNLPD